MDDYVKREEAAKTLCKHCGVGCVDNHFPMCNHYNALFKIPAADVRENVRGEWVEKYYFDGKNVHCCSECRSIIGLVQTYVYNFCPFCGADIKGKQNGNTN